MRFLFFCFVISPCLILFCIDGSFTFQTLFPLVFLSLLFFLLSKRNTIELKFPIKCLIFINIIFIISLFLNFFIHPVDFYSIIQIMYHLVILIWFTLMLQLPPSNKLIKYYFLSVIVVCSLMSLYVIYHNLILGNTVFSITTFFGITINKNHFAVWISLAILLCLYFVLFSKKKLLYIILLIFNIFAVIFMNSRGAILSSILCCSFLFIIYFISSKFNFKKIFIVIFVLLSSFFLYKPILNLMPDWLYNRYFVNSYVDSSNMDRIYRWTNALEGISTQPLLGFGPGVFVNIDKYKVTDYGITIPANTPSHNTYLDLVIDGGLIALIALLLLLLFSIKDILLTNHIFLPIVFHLLINSMILGAFKTVYFWNTIIILIFISCYLKNHSVSDLFDV